MYYYVLIEDYIVVDRDGNYNSIIYAASISNQYKIAIAYSDDKYTMTQYIRNRYSLIHRIKINDVSIIKVNCSDEADLLHIMESNNVLMYRNDMIIKKMSYDDNYTQYLTLGEWRNIEIDARLQIYEYIEDAIVSMFRLLYISRYLRNDTIDTEFLIKYLQYILYTYIKPSVYYNIFKPDGTINNMPMDLIIWITRIGGPDNVMGEPF